MKAIIKPKTMAEMLRVKCTDDISAIALALQKFGVKHDKRTIRAHVLSGDVSPLFDIPMLVSICRDRHYAFAPCLKITDDSGRLLGNRKKGYYHTDEPLVINIRGLARATNCACPVSVIQKKLNILIDRHFIYLVGRGDLSCLSGIPSGKFISSLLTYGIDLNDYFVQKGFCFPVVSRSQDVKVPTNRIIQSYRDLGEEFLDVTDKMEELQMELYNHDATTLKVIEKCMSDSNLSKEDSLMEVATAMELKGKRIINQYPLIKL